MIIKHGNTNNINIIYYIRYVETFLFQGKVNANWLSSVREWVLYK